LGGKTLRKDTGLETRHYEIGKGAKRGKMPARAVRSCLRRLA
jgi:hypothetical protein